MEKRVNCGERAENSADYQYFDGFLLELCTEKQFSKMEYITGMSTSEVIDSDERLIIL